MKTSVAIVGGGPVGLALALFLDMFGVDCAIFNLEKSTRWHPKGSTHNARTVEHYRRLGMAPAIRNCGLPRDHPTDVAYFTRYNAWELARIKMPSEREKQAAVAASAQTDQVLEPLLRTNQMYVERFLLETARTRSRITLRFGWRVTEFAQDEDGVFLRLENVAGGAPAEAWQAAYLVGCDGGASFVRRTLGLRYQGESTLEQVFWAGR
jgi:2-polyprenyl-6-methoxyphenol hydroxylase-like FAD-dependent oxidoreductase